jgi:hypothetical protein
MLVRKLKVSSIQSYINVRVKPVVSMNNSMLFPIRSFAATSDASAAASATDMVLNFTTPYATLYKGKEVERISLPGEAGMFPYSIISL